VVGLIALEGLLGFSFPFYPFYPYNTEYHYGNVETWLSDIDPVVVSTRYHVHPECVEYLFFEAP
jgi:hypothetical protein